MALPTAGRRIFTEWLAVALLATVAVAVVVGTDLFRRADNLVYDQLVRLEREPPSSDIIVIAIDDESLSRLGSFPWPRDLHARLLERLAAAKPRAILYDVLFVDPTPADERLAQAIAVSRPVIPLYTEVPGRNGEAVTVIEPVTPVRAAGAEVGHANLSPDEDGIVRRVFLAEGADGRLWPHIAALAACRAAKAGCNLPQATEERGFVRTVPYLIPYAGGRQHFRTVPFAAVLDGSVPDEFFRNRIVLVGATATGLSDVYATPFAESGALMPGVELNGNIIQALISGRAIEPAGPVARYALALVPLWLLLAGFLFARPRFNLLLGLGLGAAAIGAVVALLLLGGLWASPVAALAGLVVVYPLWGWRRLEATTSYMREELERFRRDPDLRIVGDPAAGEAVQNDIELLQGAITRARDLQHFVTDTLKGLPDASFVVGPDGNIVMFNERAGLLVGNAEGWHFTSAVGALASGQVFAGDERRPGDGSLPGELTAGGRHFDVRWSAIRTGDGTAPSWVLRLADVTELRTATRQREEALQFLTHDMRSPQASIISTLAQAPEAVDSRIAKRIEAYARRTLALADGFVQLARAEAQPLPRDEVDLCEVVLDAADDLWPQSSARGMTVETPPCDEERLVLGDRTLLTRAAINLLSNAIKYSPEGSTVRCGVDTDGDRLVLFVEDKGPGLDEAQIARLCERFDRLGRGGTEGVGLGLSFVQVVASRHGGEIACRSEVGNGARFELRLPAAPNRS